MELPFYFCNKHNIIRLGNTRLSGDKQRYYPLFNPEFIRSTVASSVVDNALRAFFDSSLITNPIKRNVFRWKKLQTFKSGVRICCDMDCDLDALANLMVRLNWRIVYNNWSNVIEIWKNIFTFIHKNGNEVKAVGQIAYAIESNIYRSCWLCYWVNNNSKISPSPRQPEFRSPAYILD